MKRKQTDGKAKTVTSKRPTQITTDAPPTSPLGQVLRQRRLELKLRLKDVAQPANLGVGFLSQVERNHSSPSVAALIRLCHVLGITVGSLFRSHNTAAVIRGNEREVMRYGGEEMQCEIASSREAHGFVAFIVNFKPNGQSGKDLHSVESTTEFLLVISGSLTVEVEKERYELNEGDSLTFDPRRPHRCTNPTRSKSVSLCVLSPAPA